MPAVGVPIDQLSPDSSYVQLILGAVYDIRICQEIFDGWAAQLDKCVPTIFQCVSFVQVEQTQFREIRGTRARAPASPESSPRRRGLVFACDRPDPSLPCTVRLSDGAEDRPRVEVVVEGPEVRPRHDETRERYQQGFPRAFPARRANAGELEIVRVGAGEDGGAEELNGETDLGVVEAPVQRAREYLCAWVVCIPLPKLRRARRRPDLACCVCSLESSCRILWGGGIRYVSFRIYMEVIRFRRLEIGAGSESESIESVIRFLKDVVPKEAQTAQKSLARFDEALFVMGLEVQMKTGRRVALRGPNSNLSEVAEEWRKIAKQYQSMVPDDEDPDD
jgi:hypothetical protein